MSTALSKNEDYSDSVDITGPVTDQNILVRSRLVEGGVARISVNDVDGYIRALQKAKRTALEKIENHQRWQDNLEK